MQELSFTVAFPFCGLGAGAMGFLAARVAMLGREATFRSVGGIDNDPLACQDFEALTKSPALCADISTLMPGDVARFFGPTAPDVVFGSAPCKGASGLLSQKLADTPKYREMNELALKWTELMLRAWDVPPRLVLFENVPRLKTRAPEMVAKVVALLRRAGYSVSDGFHDCGELGGLAQHRRRYLLVARHQKRVPPILYQPIKKRVRACGEVLSALPMPNDPAGGPMHVMPKISWLNWVRLALIPAGGDWRDLPGVLADDEARREKFKRHAVEGWQAPVGTVGGPGTNGVENVADPRVTTTWFGGSLGVKEWQEPSGTVTGESWPQNGAFSVSDPRIVPQAGNGDMHWGKYQVRAWDEPAGTVIGADRVGSGAQSVADPRLKTGYDHAYRVLRWEEPSFTVAGGSHIGQGAYAVGDPRLGSAPRAGAYGVIPWTEAAKTITGVAGIDNGSFAVADPRLPDAAPVMVIRDIRKPPSAVPVILAEDGTWHRPLTTLELAALQGLPWMLDGKPLVLAGTSQSGHRSRIGNAVPPPAAQAIAERMLVTLVQADAEAFMLSDGGPVWAEPEAIR